MADMWDWQGDDFKLDGESPLAEEFAIFSNAEITRCLWDELAPSEEDSRSLFSTPLADIASQDPPFYSFRGHQDEDSLSQHYSNGGLQAGGNSPRMKRRRLLFSEDPVYDHCDTQEESDSVIESFTNCIDPIMQVCTSELQESLEDNSLQAADSLWYRRCDDMPSPFGGVETGSRNWSAKSTENAHFDDPTEINTKFNPVWPEEQCLERREEDMIQGPGTPGTPGTPLSGRSPMYKNDNAERFDNKGAETITKKQELFTPPATPPAYPKSCTPVAYPFTLLKPSETEGDITLKDINQRILMPPSRPLPQQQLQAVDENSWSFGGCCSPTDPGLGLSGKCIVSRTKIHTQGYGTITIMRTRG